MDYNGGCSKKMYSDDTIIPDEIMMAIKTEPEVLIEHEPADLATCEKKLDALRGVMEYRLDQIQTQLNMVLDAQEEANALLRNFITSNQDLRCKFPLKTSKKLRELNSEITPENRNTYINTIKTLLKPQGVIKNLKYILSTDITNEYNVEGVHGKQCLKDLNNFYDVLIDSIEVTATSGTADQQLRKAISLAKKRYFKSKSIARPRASASDN
ncbi:hypothetical protein FF38_07177 [Lucilia cuprina]|uniref:DUF4806 domain-containing protein n=1 Tax=Lucilia cuprina TaxID=7375 RepID=A0A0L0BSY8_LUCCU|nr:uncharacterized protein LOC111682919 [Lucilia cuprina]KAI8119951.1 hypothetical protein CVS40_8722 [Lucilia cuprina]KNC23098.1 hypothetical protein FF38_07177 [Lucilia cuprina]